jgi:hypothetical protein
MRTAYINVVGKPAGKTNTIHKRRWEENINMNVKERGREKRTGFIGTKAETRDGPLSI